MLESMIQNPRPTRAEASDVANAILDGTDAVMLSGESAVGDYPVEAVKMLASIASDIEETATFTNYAPRNRDKAHALAEALNTIDQIIELQCIVAFTETGYSAVLAASERPSVPVIALTPSVEVYHRLNLVWGVRPVLFTDEQITFEGVMKRVEEILLSRNWAKKGDQVLILGGYPYKKARTTSYLDIHTVGEKVISHWVQAGFVHHLLLKYKKLLAKLAPTNWDTGRFCTSFIIKVGKVFC
jgi:pyruvate kinase